MNTITTQQKIQPQSTDNPETDFQPIKVLELEIGDALPTIDLRDAESGEPYRRALALVRLHSQPTGNVELRFDDVSGNTVNPTAYVAQIWAALSDAINGHLRDDGLPEVGELPVGGLPDASATPKCLQARQALLANAPYVSVIVATHNRAHSLPATLNSLLALDYPNFEIVIVDNAPSDDSTAELIKQQYQQAPRPIRYVREDRAGLGCAHNAGMKVIDAPFVAFTDDDVLVDRNWLSELVKDFFIADDIACVTGMILPAELQTQSQLWIEQYGGFSKGFSRRIFDSKMRLGPLYPFTAGTFGSGASMAFKTSVLREMGGFDSALGAGTTALGGDDLDAFFQVVIRGYKLVYEPAAILHHWHRREYAGLHRQAYGYGVGLTAYLTKSLLTRPDLLLGFLVKFPYGLFYIFSNRSPKNSKKRADYPKELNWLERKGMLHGPVRYWRSRRELRRGQS